MYFKLQMIVSVLLALTYPGGSSAAAATAAGKQGETALLFHGSASLQGLTFVGGEGKDRFSALVPLGIMFVFSATNVLFVAPGTIRMMWKLQLGMFDEMMAQAFSLMWDDADDDDDE